MAEGDADSRVLVGVSEYARRAGVNKSTISRQVGKGIIPNHAANPEKDPPLIDPAEADAARQKDLDQSKSRKPEAASPAGGAQDETPRRGSAEGNWSQARAHREKFVGLSAELEYRQRVGELCRLSTVHRTAMDAGRELRDLMLGLPSRIAGELVAKAREGAGEREVAQLLRARITDTLKQASDLTARVSDLGDAA